MLAAGILGLAGVGFLLPQPSSPDPGGGNPAPWDRPPRTASSRNPHSGGVPGEPVFQVGLNPESQAWLRALEELAARNPQQAVAKLGAIQDPDLLSLAFQTVAAGWAKLDPQAAAEWVSGLQSEDQGVSAALGLVPVWAAKAPTDCLDWTTSRPAGNLREVSLVELADAWSSENPREALSRYLSLPREDGSERGLHAIVSQWTLNDPQAAVEHLGALGESARRDEFLEAALVSLTNQDPDLTWNYSTRFDNPATVEHVRSMALEAMAETRPQDAIKLAATGGNSEILLAGIARGWAAYDEAAAKKWIATIPDPDLSARLLKGVSK